MPIRIYRVEFGQDAVIDVVAKSVLEAVEKAMKKPIVTSPPKWKMEQITEVSLLAWEDEE